MAFLIKKFVLSRYEKKRQIRGAYGICCSFVGLVSNIILFAFKLTIGMISSSVSIIADSFNNFSDALSYIITLIGFKFILKAPDEKHPFGYGRAEYICSLVVCVFIFMTGMELLKSSISEIINPSEIEMSYIVYIVLFFSILLKFYLSRFFKKTGEEIKSSVLIANSRDSFMDMFSSSIVLLGLFISNGFKISLDGYLGLVITALIIYTSFKTFKENIGPMLGEAPDEEFVSLIKNKIKNYKEIKDIKKISLHNYGSAKTVVYLKVLIKKDLELEEILNKISEIENKLGEDLLCSFVINFDIK